jgi:hypothetical protein
MAANRVWSGLVVAVLLSACAPKPTPSASVLPRPPSLGTVIGYIEPCFGVPPPTSPPSYSGTVIVVRSGATVASVVVAAGNAYHFTLAPGSYRLVAHDTPDQNNRWVDVAVVGGQTTRQDIPNTCK